MRVMQRIALAAAVFAAALGAYGRPAAPAAVAAIGATDTVSVAVGTVLGATIGRIVGEFEQGGVTLDRALVSQVAAKAIGGSYTGLSLEQAQLIVNGILEQMQPMAGVDSFDTASQVRFLDEAAARPGAVRTPSGVVLEVITEGEGAMPRRDDSVSVFYVGRLSDGTVFDATDDPWCSPSPTSPRARRRHLHDAAGRKVPRDNTRIASIRRRRHTRHHPGRAALQFIVELIEVVKQQK